MLLNVRDRREQQRIKRLRRLLVALWLVACIMWIRFGLLGLDPIPSLPRLSGEALFLLPVILLVVLLGAIVLLPMAVNGRSPHVVYGPEQLDVGFSDVKGLGPVVAEIEHTLRVFLDYQRFQEELGGRPRRGVLFEGPPGTGKTHVAKAMAKEAGVPFLFVSSTSFQTMWYGMTARRIKAFFRALRRTARREGGAIGFIEEIDAIGMARRQGSAATESVAPAVASDAGGVVNELLIQMQSFDEPLFRERLAGAMKDLINSFLPSHRQLRKRPVPYSNILLIAATNRAAALDMALLRPGRFDRVLHFDLPGRAGRRELIDYFLELKAHDLEVGSEAGREELTSATAGYSPASLERLFDEALLLALRDDRSAMSLADLRRARVEIEIGLPEPVDSPLHERETIATHEAGHATIAYLVGEGRTLEVLSIVKRREALGFLAHRLKEERHTQRRSEMEALIQIAFGGMVAEELFFGESGSGPAGDLVVATNTAAEMVGSLGLGGSLISLRAAESGLGENLVTRVLADQPAREAMDRILAEQKARVVDLLEDHRHMVEALRDALLDRLELVDSEIVEVIRRAEGRRLAQVGPATIDLRDDSPTVEPRPVADRQPDERVWGAP